MKHYTLYYDDMNQELKEKGFNSFNMSNERQLRSCQAWIYDLSCKDQFGDYWKGRILQSYYTLVSVEIENIETGEVLTIDHKYSTTTSRQQNWFHRDYTA